MFSTDIIHCKPAFKSCRICSNWKTCIKVAVFAENSVIGSCNEELFNRCESYTDICNKIIWCCPWRNCSRNLKDISNRESCGKCFCYRFDRSCCWSFFCKFKRFVDVVCIECSSCYKPLPWISVEKATLFEMVANFPWVTAVRRCRTELPVKVCSHCYVKIFCNIQDKVYIAVNVLVGNVVQISAWIVSWKAWPLKH